jgi:hypothetical protein
MTKDDILSMARESGFERLFGDVDWVCLDEDLERFAALVAEKEREQLMNEPLTKEMWQRFEDEIRASEREVCAKVADDQWVRNPNVSGGDAIRARGRK